MSCRLVACAEILRVHVLPRLHLRDVQALRQTCTALYQAVVAADAEVNALALVRERCLCRRGSEPSRP